MRMTLDVDMAEIVPSERNKKSEEVRYLQETMGGRRK